MVSIRCQALVYMYSTVQYEQFLQCNCVFVFANINILLKNLVFEHYTYNNLTTAWVQHWYVIHIQKIAYISPPLLSAGLCRLFLYTHLLFATGHILVDCQIHTTKTTQLTCRHTEQEAATILTFIYYPQSRQIIYIMCTQ